MAKLNAFAAIEQEFIASFSFLQQVHGQRRFDNFPLAQSVRYLHALYICECKDRLLSVPHTASRYEGARCLELMRQWSLGESAGVVAFVHRKLDDQPYGEMTARIEETFRAGDAVQARRLISGRAVLLNRNITLSHALDAIFAVDPERMARTIAPLCAKLGHTPKDIDRQLAEMRTNLYGFAPTSALARRNMLLMNHLGQSIMDMPGNHPGERTDRVLAPSSHHPSYAEEVIAELSTLVSLHWIGREPRPDTKAPANTRATPPAGS